MGGERGRRLLVDDVLQLSVALPEADGGDQLGEFHRLVEGEDGDVVISRVLLVIRMDGHSLYVAKDSVTVGPVSYVVLAQHHQHVLAGDQGRLEQLDAMGG